MELLRHQVFVVVEEHLTEEAAPLVRALRLITVSICVLTLSINIGNRIIVLKKLRNILENLISNIQIKLTLSFHYNNH
jgi:ribosomal protein S25